MPRPEPAGTEPPAARAAPGRPPTAAAGRGACSAGRGPALAGPRRARCEHRYRRRGGRVRGLVGRRVPLRRARCGERRAGRLRERSSRCKVFWRQRQAGARRFGPGSCGVWRAPGLVRRWKRPAGAPAGWRAALPPRDAPEGAAGTSERGSQVRLPRRCWLWGARWPAAGTVPAPGGFWLCLTVSSRSRQMRASFLCN